MKLIDIQGTSQPDPYIIKSGDHFYVYATAVPGVTVYRARELFGEWEYLGICATVEGMKSYWAPSVIELDGKFYMYVSFMPNDSFDAHDQAMNVFTADKPEGPFTLVKQIIEPFSIDSHIVKNESGLYLFYSINDYEAERAGTYVVVDRMLDPFTPEGKPVAVVRPTLDEEIYCRDRFRKGQHWHTLEGGFYFREGDWHYVMYSGNCFESEYYYVGYATAHSSESDLTKLKFTKYPSEDGYCPIIRANEVEEGPGHNSVIKVDGEYYMVYHARDWGAKENGDKNFDYRTARIAKLNVKDGVITLA